MHLICAACASASHSIGQFQTLLVEKSFTDNQECLDFEPGALSWT